MGVIFISKSYYCEGCGGVMEFNATAQALKCPNCGTEVKIENNPEDVIEHNLDIHAIKTIKVEEKTSTSMECEGCGARVEVDATSTATTCPYCGSHYVLSQKQIESIIPDGVIPFKIDKYDVESIFSLWIKKRWLAPNVLKTLYQKDKVQGMYMPYWTFDADTSTNYTAMGGIDYKVEYEDSEGEKHTRIETNWYPTSGHINHFFDDVLVRASNKLSENLLGWIEPYNTKDVASYSPDYMSGYCSEIYTVDLKDAHIDAMNKMRIDIHYMAERDVLRRYDRVRSVRLYTSYSDETYKHIFIPVYSTAYTYKDKQYNVLINGETGKIKGEYPKSPVKIAAIIIVILGILFGIYLASSDDDVSYNDDKKIQYSELVKGETVSSLEEIMF
ncbi:hypothetical protein TEGL_36100 [Terrisporobacter glycolicus ATCC 14880 = DSM 1288]|uniref:Zinc finger domain protein, LSD1 subclass n=2 Tax=Terrisporobacter glycolicus TaxID=36841 RepID=A0ABZ2EZ23_9FIRM